jgi:DNA-binding NtrC family response regulator
VSPEGATPVVLIVDDTAANRRLLTAVFRAEGMTPVAVEGGAAALVEAAARVPDVVLLDLHMPGMDGLQTLARLRETAPGVPVVMLTAHGDVATAVEAIKLGAYDFLTRPVGNDKLVLTVQRALERQKLVGEVAELRRRLVSKESLAQLMGPSAQVARIAREVEQVAGTSMTALILGETGTGKELVARAVHAASPRAAHAFVAIDCGALPDTLLESELFGYERGAFTGAERRKEGYLEIAAGGTLFLDEVANLTALTQAKLLRVLQERRVTPLGATRPVDIDVRVIAATHEPLDGRAADGRFRQDLYYRLSEFVIRLPALRDRREDVAPLAQRFLEEACVEWHRHVVGFAAPALRALEAHAWPGNVRELRNVVRRAVLAAAEPEISAAEIVPLLGGAPPVPPAGEPLPAGASLKDIAERAAGEAERAAIVEALRDAGGNKSQAARALKVDFKTLSAKMRRLGIG